MKHRFIGIITLVLILSVLLILPLAAQAYDDGTTCANNGKHEFVAYNSQDATCEREGFIDWECMICKKTVHQVTGPALGHNFQFVVRDQPTCTTPGYGIDTCTRCGANRDNGRRIDALGHNYQRSVAQEATCTKDGMAVYTCSRCGDSYREPIPATGHKWGAWVDGDAATCVQYGNRYHECTRCGQKEWERNYAGGLGDHDWGEWVTVKEPTATEPGLLERTCKVDASHKEQEVIPAIGEPEPDPATNEPTEELHPELTLTYLGDSFYLSEAEVEWHFATPPVLSPWNRAYAWGRVENSGDIEMKIVEYVEYGDGKTLSQMYNTLLSPSKGFSSGWGGYLSDHITPGTETVELLGTVTITWWAVGYDPETGEELCKSSEITSTWKVGKGESQLEVKIDATDKAKSQTALTNIAINEALAEYYGTPGLNYDQWADPAGYQLGELWAAEVGVKNIGSVDVNGCILHTDVTAISDTGSLPFDLKMPDNEKDTTFDIIVTGKKVRSGIGGMISEADVARGYIEAKATVKWTDPDSGNEKIAYSNVWHAPVISKTGLLLKKGYKAPANGEYFEEGEQIEWTLSMKNNSREPIKDITVTDNGATIGMFAEVTPEQGEIKLGVPKYTVTEYDAKVIGKVTNIANATGTDLKGVEHTYPSNPAVAKAGNKAPDPNDGDGGGGTDPLGPIYGYDIAISIIKAEAHGPAQEDWYALNENVDYTVTVKNTGKDPIENVTVYDSLNGFAPIGTVGSLAPGEEKTFSFTWKVTQYNVDVMHYVVNQATVTYTFGGGINGTPMKSNKVYVKAGENGYIPEDGLIDPDGDPDGHFDPSLLHGEGDDCCAMTLFYTRDNEADYQLTLCGEHAKVIADAKTAADAGDWKTAAETIRAALDEIYAKYYEAGDDSAKAAVMNERLTYYAHIGAYQTLAGDKAAAEKMALKLIQLCSMANTAPETLPDSLANGMNGILGDNPDVTVTGRVIGLFDGKNEVTDTYAGADARALKDVKDLLKAAKSYNYDEVFERGQIIWQAALDESVNAIYKAADRETRKQIAAWRISLDNLYTGERPMLEMLYPDNDAAVEEILMNLYRDTTLDKEQVR